MRWTEHRRRIVVPVCIAFALLAALVVAWPNSVSAQTPDIDEVNEQLGIGVNLGNALEGPREGEWGLTLRQEFFSIIAQAGFRHVRVPIRFSAYTGAAPDYEIPDGVDPTVPNADNLWERVDWVIANAEQNGLYVILDLHLYDELSDDVQGERDRFLAIWRQIATRYADASPKVLFELLNEPQGQFNDDPALLNTLIADGLAIIRDTNPTRPVIVGPMYWNGIAGLDSLVLPDDPNLIVSVHFYDPFDFTHQGASWVEPVPPAPASFDPDIIGFGAGWWDWSWRSLVVPGPDSLRVDFERQWAGLGFGRPFGVTPESLRVVVSGASELSVRCEQLDAGETEITRFATTEAVATYTFDMTGCAASTQVVKLMLASPSADTLEFYEIELCLADGSCTRLIETGRQAIGSAFDVAEQWAEQHDRPMHVGEFGAYSANGLADLSDRAQWTEIVRSAGRARDFSMSYWEFGAGFGVFNPATNNWIDPLVDALDLPSPPPTPTPTPAATSTPVPTSTPTSVPVSTPTPLDLCNGKPVTIQWGPGAVATAGDDVILGTSADDVIDALDGDDTVCAGGGDDWVVGGQGHDVIFGDGGDDKLFGRQGHDQIHGGAGDDAIHGNIGNDVLFGEAGADRIFGYANNDTIFGGAGDDRLHGNFGFDVIEGGEGDDAIFGYGDDDELDGGPGDDIVSGNRGNDLVNGGDGRDELWGADGNDEVNGGPGDDIVNGNSLNDMLTGGLGNDTLDGGIDADVCSGGPGTDTATRCEELTGVP